VTVRPSDWKIAPIVVLLFAKDGDYSQSRRAVDAVKPVLLRSREWPREQ
jgi:hypothetical protein